MSSDQQIAANRLNAQRSTGPRTPTGKARVSMNALKHGLTGRDVVLPNENPDEFDSFRKSLLADLAPQGSLEVALAEEIVVDFWRLRRVPIFEAALYRRGCQELAVKQEAEVVRQYESTESERLLASLEKRKVAVSDRQAHEEAQKRLESARAGLDDLSLNVTRLLQISPEPFSNLWRHEYALARSRSRALHELQRLQAARAGEHVTAPAVVDVDVGLPESRRVDIGRTGPSGATDGNQQ
jgi:hypothetical protein